MGTFPGQLALEMLVWKAGRAKPPGAAGGGVGGCQEGGLWRKQGEGRVAEEDLGHRCGGRRDRRRVGVGWAAGKEERLPLSQPLLSFSSPSALPHSPGPLPSGPPSSSVWFGFCFKNYI